MNVQTNTDVTIRLSARIQPIYYYTDNAIISERDLHDVRIRRARLSVKASMGDYIHSVLQTDYSEQPSGASAEMKVIDAYTYFNLHDEKNITVFLGQFLAPSLRQNITSADALMTIDRPGIAYKALSWGTRSQARFATLTIDNTDAGLRGNVDVRDIGIMLSGEQSLNKSLHMKYYAGIFEGARTSLSERIVLRGQLNWGDREKGYILKSTYLGHKDTFAIGISHDTQSKVALNSLDNGSVDYTLSSIDLFAEKPYAFASITFEAAFIRLNLGDSDTLLDPSTLAPINNTPTHNAQGRGVYMQTGFLIGKWQPWFGYEEWQSDQESNAGSYNGIRTGLTYIINDHKANIKVGIERINADQNFNTSNGSTNELTTFSAGLFLTF